MNNFETVSIPLPVALGLRTNGKPDLPTITARKAEKGLALVTMCQVNPAMDADYIEARAKFVRSLDEMQKQFFAKLENRPGLLAVYGPTSCDLEKTAAPVVTDAATVSST